MESFTSKINDIDYILKPCPHCLGRPVVDRILRDGYEDDKDDQDAYAYFVRCCSCASQGGWRKNPGGAVMMWNMRDGNWRDALEYQAKP